MFLQFVVNVRLVEKILGTFLQLIKVKHKIEWFLGLVIKKVKEKRSQNGRIFWSSIQTRLFV